jgi:hypothetical protein
MRDLQECIQARLTYAPIALTNAREHALVNPTTGIICATMHPTAHVLGGIIARTPEHVYFLMLPVAIPTNPQEPEATVLRIIADNAFAQCAPSLMQILANDTTIDRLIPIGARDRPEFARKIILMETFFAFCRSKKIKRTHNRDQGSNSDLDPSFVAIDTTQLRWFLILAMMSITAGQHFERTMRATIPTKKISWLRSFAVESGDSSNGGDSANSGATHIAKSLQVEEEIAMPVTFAVLSQSRDSITVDIKVRA